MKNVPLLLIAVAAVSTFFSVGIATAQDVYVSDTASPNSLTVIAPNGSETTLTSSTYIDEPTGLAFNSSGDLFIANSGTGEITEYNTATGQFSDFVATGLVNPQGLAFDSNGNLYVANDEPSASGGGVTQYQINGSGAITHTNSLYAGSQNNPSGIAVDGGGNLYVTLSGNSIARVAAGGGAASTTDFTVSPSLNGPVGIVFGPHGDLYVVNSNDPSVEEIPVSLEGSSLLNAAGNSSLHFPEGLIFDADDNLFVSDEGSNQVTEYSAIPGGNGQYELINTFNGGSGPTYLADGPAPDLVPEPATYVLLLSGLLAVFFYQRRRTAVLVKA